jgi:hypothetical protein
MIFLTIIIQPWPPQEFGTLLDSQTFARASDNGIQREAFLLYTKAIFDKDVLQNANFTPKVSLRLFDLSFLKQKNSHLAVSHTFNYQTIL